MKMPAFAFLVFVFAFLPGSKKEKYTPPGTVRLNDTLFIDKTEMTNIGWREYLVYLDQVEKDSVAANNAMPDRMVWSVTTVDSNGMITKKSTPPYGFYLDHPAFNDYPVVGITYEQAVDYCKWRTYVTNLAIYFKENKLPRFKTNPPNDIPIHFYYRLPTRDEWELAASADIDSSTKVFKKWYRNAVFTENVKERIDSISHRKNLPSRPGDWDEVMIMNAVSFFPNKYGLYNITGNVAEMINEKGIAKGGSFAHRLKECQPGVDLQYSKPQQWLGFRCVAVLTGK